MTTYSNAEIQRISGSRLAIYNRKYIESNGDIWIGTADNRLKLVYTKDVNVGVELNSIDPVVNLKEYLKGLNTTISQLQLKQVEVDFGEELYTNIKIFTISDPDVTSTNIISAVLAYDAPTDKDLDELDMDPILVSAGTSRVGSFQLIVKGLEGSLRNKFKINYTIK